MEKTKTIKGNQGFTLIELLVVISIIALLSVIVLAAVNDARDRAKNTKKNEIAMQYLNALSLIRSDGSFYPLTNNSKCLGYDPAVPEKCRSNFTGDTNLNNSISQYYPDMPKYEDFSFEYRTGITTRGIEYDCRSTSTCFIFWYLKGDASCPAGSNKTGDGLIYTKCDVDLTKY